MTGEQAERIVFSVGVGLVYVGAAVLGLTFGNVLGRLVLASVQRLDGSKFKT